MTELNAFIRASDRVVQFHAYFSAIPQDEHTIHTLEVQKDEIIHLWSALRTLYDSLLGELEAENVDVDISTVQNKFFVAYNAHLKCLSKANELLDQLFNKSSEPVEIINFQQVPNPSISLPPCDTDIFYGDYLSWPTFRDMFSALYINNPRLTPVEKLFHLIKKTQNEARDIVKTCPLTNAGFEMAWKNLVDRFENKEVLLNAQLKTLFSLSSISKESGPSIKALQRTINDSIKTLTLLNIETDKWDVIFVYLCSTCLPDVTLDLWKQQHGSNSELNSWGQMDKFLTSRYQTLESFADLRSSKPSFNYNKLNSNSKTQTKGSKNLNSYHTNIQLNKPMKCSLCPEPHPIRQCPVFLKMSVDERFTLVKKQRRCTNCLATSHDFKACKSQYVCSFCKMKHHTLLHRRSQSAVVFTSQSDKTPQIVSSDSQINNPNRSNNIHPHAPSNTDEYPSTSAASTARNHQSYSTQLQYTQYKTILLGTALVDLCVGGVRHPVRALIDPASEASFVSSSLKRKLSLPHKLSHTRVIGLNGALAATPNQICLIHISSPVEKQFSVNVEAFSVKKLTGQLPYHSLSKTLRSRFSDLQMADVEPQKNASVDLLLGGDIYPYIIREGIRWEKGGSLVAQNTVFGWIVTGQLSPVTQSVVSTFYNEIDLNFQLTRFWEQEEVPGKRQLSEEDSYCEDLYSKTTYRNEHGRFVVSLPFKKEFPVYLTLGHSRNCALTQYTRNESRLIKEPLAKKNYDEVIIEYLKLGHMTRVHPDLSANPNTSYYLPHHAVIKPDSTTTKIRVVFNASNPTSNGISLNDILYRGPVLQVDLTTLILRWRFFRYVFNADIEKMYRQILVDKAHTPFQRIVFRNSPDEELSDFEMNTVTFGVNCAPYLAIRTLLELAKQCESENPIVSEILQHYMYVDDVLFGSHDIDLAIKSRNFFLVIRTLLELAKQCESENPIVSEILQHYMYVDDVLFGSHDIDLAIKSRNDLVKVLKTAGFSLRKWTANHDRILQGIPPEQLLDNEFLKLSESCTSKTLGLRWNAGSDDFYFEHVFTKRVVLSEIARLFDPAGWLAPKIVVAKLIMQQIWKDKTDWDEVLNPLTLKQWEKFANDYPNIERIRIPRFVNYDPPSLVELHGFCDASDRAYAATLYIRTEDPNGHVHTHLLAAKTKVAPIKFLTLPRKELCGAELMAKMYKSISTQLKLESHKVFMWTDSTIVLAWLKKPADQWKTFVANRVSTIVEILGHDVWLHVDSSDNPADIASRGCTASDLATKDIWWYGPSWLKLSHSHWPSHQPNLETQEEIRIINSHATQVLDIDILNSFSDLTKAMRVLCYVFRFYHNISSKHETHYTDTNILQTEMKHIKDRLVILCQKMYFPEYNILSRGLVLSKKSNLLSLNPFIDTNGFLRVNGRLPLSPMLTYDERFSKLLPYNGRFTRLYLELIHNTSIHGENSLLLRLMRIEFWVPKLKTLTKAIVRNCKDCVLQKHIQSRQIMGVLPPERTSLSRPFTNTGVDFAGPFEIKSYVGRGCKMTKGYVLVFICFATKAIHLEVTSEISTSAFMAAFSRFFSRRGCPHTMYSDNGKAFVGAANTIAKNGSEFLSLVRQNVINKYAYQRLEWHFIPPGAPHMGGLWEAGVKSFKTHLKKIYYAQKFTFEEFSTMLIRIEACLNSRPLSPMTESPDDLCALTPGHFLIGAPLLAPAEPDLSHQSLSYANRWKKLKLLHHQFAIRWKEEYLKELHKRTKWQYPQRDFKQNDLVVVRRDNYPPNQWRLGRIERVYRGPDERVRVCDVRTADGLITRPIVKLVLLPQHEQQ